MRRILAITLVAFLTMAGTAWATTTSGNQNPDLRVTASVLPTHAHAGDVVTAKATITNTTNHKLPIGFEFEFDQPTRGVGGAGEGTIAPGQTLTFTFHRTVHGPTGDYRLWVRADGTNGASHTTAHASSS